MLACLFTTCMPGVHEGQNIASSILELEVHMNHLVAENSI